ncbi:hypothetical protein GYMLUDRAFT_78058 [Collybiopsis luxurians FD-317 M1]|uniref:Uncharacterized protein n=1 Tax=Collybiopsis luxurians FD-317 M1 TaxID=944289 RepID=A0A0D0C1V7_9AGAR|nr:hypothetical protein GYMLUDRAFT_78058 [Collybiopsis luxurians FD-317 M1]
MEAYQLGQTIEASQSKTSSVHQATPETKNAIQRLQMKIDELNRQSGPLLGELEALQKVHPFTAEVILAFKTAIKLEYDHRTNDKRALAVRIAMNDMFIVMLILKGISGAKKNIFGESIQTCLQKHIKAVANDIKEYSATCDTFQSTHTSVKSFRSPEWDYEFKIFINSFQKHRDGLYRHITPYIDIPMPLKEDTFAEISNSFKAVGDDMPMDVLLRELRSNEERESRRFIDLHGGAKEVLKNDALMGELIRRSGEPDSKLSSPKEKMNRMLEIKCAIPKKVADLIAKNRGPFFAKFEAQLKHLRDTSAKIEKDKDWNIDDELVEDADNTLVKDPDERIVNPELNQIWQEMESGWKSTTNAQSMAMAVRKNYSERRKNLQSTDRRLMERIPAIVHLVKASQVQENMNGTDAMNWNLTQNYEKDDWALEYITLPRIQKLLEALNNESSTIVSTEKVNTFTAARPKNWSLAKWMTFWTVGFPLTMKYYYNRIQVLLYHIENLTQQTLPINGQAVKVFVSGPSISLSTDRLLAGVCDAIDDIDDDEEVFPRFECYMKSEEERMRNMLQILKYRVDAKNSLQLVTGPGGLVKNVMCLVYLLFFRVYQVLRLATTHAIDPKEVGNILDSLRIVHEAISFQVESLQAVCQQQSLNFREQLRRTSNGIFYYTKFPEDLLASKYWTTMYGNRDDLRSTDTFEDVKHVIPVQQVSDPSLADIDAVHAVPPGELLHPAIADSLDVEVYTEPDDFGSSIPLLDGSPAGSRPSWCGSYSYSLDYGGAFTTRYPAGVIDLLVPEWDGYISGSGSDNIGEFSIEGQVNGESITLNKRYTYGQAITWRYQGRLNPERSQIFGEWGSCNTIFEDFNKIHGAFQLNIAKLGICKLVNVSAGSANPNSARERWHLAVNSVITLLRIKKRKFTGWIYLQNRRQIRRRFLELFPRLHELESPLLWRAGNPLSDDEMEEFLTLVSCCSRKDFRFYRSLSACLQRRKVVHWGKVCELVHQPRIIDTRFVCLDCLRFHPVSAVASATMDFCAECINKAVDRKEDGMHHIPSHDMLQLRYCCSARRESSVLLGAAVEIAKQLRTEVCYECRSTLKRPYWYCLTCPDQKGICMTCKDRLDNLYSPVGHFRRDQTAATWACLQTHTHPLSECQ